MGNPSKLGDLRAALREALIAERDGAPDGVLHNKNVIDRLKRERPPLIDHFKAELIDMALTKLYNDECGKKPKAGLSISQPDFFEDASKVLPPVSIGRRLRVDILQLPIDEALQVASTKNKITKPTRPDRTTEILNELRKCSTTGKEPVIELIKEYQKRQAS